MISGSCGVAYLFSILQTCNETCIYVVQSSTPGTAGSGGEVTALGAASTSSSAVDPRIRNDEVNDGMTGGGSATIWNRIRRLEKIVALELDASFDANARGEFQAALNRAKVDNVQS